MLRVSSRRGIDSLFLFLCCVQDKAQEADVNVTGGQTVINPWCLVGGVATSVVLPSEIVRLVDLSGKVCGPILQRTG